jgi:O-acetyl-ADP-ribose deacetylase (regulator of RNase III)
VSTPAFDLEARGVHHIVHAVGPVHGAQTPEESDRLLTSTYQAVLAEAERLGVERVAIPAISTGVFGFPERRAAAIAARTALAHDGALGEVVLVAFDPGTADVLRDAVEDARAG